METSLDLALSYVTEICCDREPNDILGSIYWNTDQINDAKLDNIAKLLAEVDPLHCISAVNTHKLSPIHAVVFLTSAIRLSRNAAGWIHYNIAHQLRLLQTTGLVEVNLPLALHSFMIMEEFQNEQVLSTAHLLLSTSLAKMAPRTAIRHGLLSAICGNPRVFLHNREALRRLEIDPPADGLDLAAAERISNAIRSKLPLVERMVTSYEVKTATHYTIEESRNFTRPAPEGEATHYLFANAGLLQSRKKLSVIRVESAKLTIDISKPGFPQFYTKSEDQYVSDLSFGIKPFATDSNIVSERALFVLEDSFSSKANISHFLLDHIPRLLAYKEIYDGPYATLLCEKQQYFLDVLRDLQIEEVLVPDERKFSVSAPVMFFTSTMFQHFDHPVNLGSERTVNALRNAFNVQSIDQPRRRLAISRADAKGRDLTNSDEVEAFLREHNFEVITLSGMSFAEQKALFQNASHVVGVHGAGLTNLLFAPKSCRVLEIIPPMVAAHSYWTLASAIGQRYFAFNADDLEFKSPNYSKWTHNPGYNQRNVTVCLDKFSRIFK